MKPATTQDPPDMQALIDAPLADPLKLYVPAGKRVIRRGPRHAYHDGIDAPKLTAKQLQDRKEGVYGEKLAAVLDYYASTSIPIERVAENTGLSIEKATYAMQRRGRE
jgi:hypothetical protein